MGSISLLLLMVQITIIGQHDTYMFKVYHQIWTMVEKRYSQPTITIEGVQDLIRKLMRQKRDEKRHPKC